MTWLREKSRAGNVTAKEIRQAGICRDLPGLGEAIPGAAICLVVGHPRPSGFYDDTHHAEGPLADRLEGGDRLQRPSRRGWPCMGGWLPRDCPGMSGTVVLVLDVDRSWPPWAFSKSSPNKVIAALELLATLIAVKLWIPDSDRQASRVALRGFTDNQSNEALVKKAMTTKYPSSLVLLELAEELAAKKCDLNLTWIRRDLNQLEVRYV